MNLTEQWQKGKLPSGFYYVYLKHLEMFDIAGSSTLSEILERGNENSLEVLAPVPSYEEYQKLLSDQLAKNEGVEINAELEAENTKLKELLKESRFLLSKTPCENMSQCLTFNDVINRIDQVLGEE